MRKAFLEFLVSDNAISLETSDDIRTVLRVVQEPIGAIALRYGLLSAGDIEIILDEQRNSQELFGEIALNMGMLRRNQLESLLAVQQLQSAVSAAEALLLSGISTAEQITTMLGRFLAEQRLARATCGV